MTFQTRVREWMSQCFGLTIANDKIERADRLLEETLELLQSGDYPADRARAMVRYVYDRPKGEPVQEAGGVMVCMAEYCTAHGLDMDQAGELELARVWTKIDKIRAKHSGKPTGAALLEQPDELDRAARAVETWWIEQGQHSFDGAPAAIFALRAALKP